MRRTNDDLEFEEEFKTDTFNGLPSRVAKLYSPDLKGGKINNAVNSRANFQTIDQSAESIDIYYLKTIKESNPIAGVQKSILKKR